MNANEIKLYLGIIVPNFAVILLILIVSVIHQRFSTLSNTFILSFFITSLIASSVLSLFFWRPLNLSTSDYIKFFVMNYAVAFLWVLILLY